MSTKPIKPLSEKGAAMLAELRAAIPGGMTDRSIAESYFGGVISGTTFRHLRLNDYRGNTAGMELVIEEALNKVRAEKKAAARELDEGDIAFVESFDKDDKLIPQIFGALRKAVTKKGEERIVMYKDYSGGGKTRLREEIEFGTSKAALDLRRLYGENTATGMPANIMRFPRGCSPTWKLYGSAVRYLAGMMGCKGPWRNNDTAEDQLFAAAQARGVALVILEEFQHASAETWTLLKLLCNDTRLVFLVITHPDVLKEWQKRASIAIAQGRFRCLTIAGPRVFTPATARPFLEPFGLNADLHAACKAVADVAGVSFDKNGNAREGGGFRTIKKICWFLRQANVERATINDVKHAIDQTQQNAGAEF